MKHLLVLLGPTAVGKTACCLQLASHYHASIVSADSRQIYRGMEIGTAAPTAYELSQAPHYFVGIKDPDQTYSAGQFELDALAQINNLFQSSNFVILSGGSMMYLDAVCKGMDDIPHVDPALRARLNQQVKDEGIEALQRLLKQLDPVQYQRMDINNTQRLVHAVEICLHTGRPYSELLTRPQKKRPFNIIKIGLLRNREELCQRINDRVDAMIAAGLEQEALRWYPQRSLNALNTVGYKEWFAYWNGQYTSKEEVVEHIKTNTRRYARKQMTWFKKDPDIQWFHPNQMSGIISFIDGLTNKL